MCRFREALEAAVIIAVLLQLMDKLDMRRLKKQVWIGAIGGVLIAVALGIVFVVVFYVAGNKLLSGNASLIFKGVIAYIASILITLVAFHMLKFYNLERKWKRKLEGAATKEVSEEGGGLCLWWRSGCCPVDAAAAASAARGHTLARHPPIPPPRTRQATERSCKWSILLLTGSATLREGVESVLFLTGVSAGTGVKSIIIPGILGIILGAAVGFFIYYL